MTNQQWRLLFGAIALGCTVAAAQPPIQEYPWALAILVVVAAVAGFLKAPPDAPGDTGE